MVFAYFLGASGMMDIWVIAFKIPNLARRLFGEGAASASFIPVYSQVLQRDAKEAKLLASTVVTVVTVILAALVVLGEVGIFAYYKFCSVHPSNQLMLQLSALMLPYMIMICIVALMAGILQTHRHFATPAAAPIVLNIFIISSLCFAGWVMQVTESQQLFYAAAGVMLAGLAQIAMQAVALKNRGAMIRPAWQVKSEAFKKIMLMMGPMILGLTATQLNTLADDVIAKCLSGSAEKGEFFMLLGNQLKYPIWEGAVSKLYYAQRLYQFPLGVLGISLATAIFPVMSSDAARGDYDSLLATIGKGLRGAVFVAIPATVGMIVVARPLIVAVFQRGAFVAEDTELTRWVLVLYSLGLCGFFSQQIVTRAFYAVQDSKMPAISAAIAVAINVVLNLTLIWPLGTAGLALSTAICSYLQVAILTVVLSRRFGGLLMEGMWQVLKKTIIASAVMYAVCVGLIKAMESLPTGDGASWFEVLRLAVLVPAAAGTYFIASKILKNESLSLITGKK
jgi:putative peptidoglycan lipid II flippase